MLFFIVQLFPISCKKWDSPGQILISVQEIAQCHNLQNEMYFENSFTFDKSQSMLSNNLVQISEEVKLNIRPLV